MLPNYNLRTWAEIDLDAIDANFESLSSHLPEGMKKLAVVKADAYGHGAVFVAKLLADRVDYFGVARADEAVELRRAGIQNTKILILGHTAPFHYSVLFKYDLIPTIYSLAEAEELSKCAMSYGQTINIHIALNTGMSRIGFEADDDNVDTVCRVASLPGINVDGIFSHFADADGSSTEFTELQLERYRRFTEELARRGVTSPVRHLFNSAAILRLAPEFDMVREGICLYGLSPSDEIDRELTCALRPAMSLRSEVIHIHEIEPGTPVSYGLKFVAEKRTKVATVCAGYADGVPRLLSNRGYVILNGRRAKILGNVCMDQFMCDITDIPDVKVGTVVTVFGRDGDEYVSADEVASIASTISYEIICAISKRVPRVYIKDGEVFDIHYGIPHEEL